MVPAPDPWPPDLAVALGERAAPFHFYERVESTNDIALALAGDGAVTGTAVLADLQQAGRGRRGRSWWSPPGAGMYLSVVVRTGRMGSSVPVLTLAAGVALARAVRAVAGLPVELKWPNDLVVGRPWRKLAGILCEATNLGTGRDAVVVGMGMNLQRSAYPPDIADRATSVAEECDRIVGRGAIVSATLEALDAVVADLEAGRAGDILDEWRTWARTALDLAPVRWRDQAGEHRGTVVELDADGALVVRPTGAAGLVRIVSGEVSWEMLTRE